MVCEIVEELKSEAIVIALSGDKINVTGDENRIKEILPRIHKHKGEIIRDLKLEKIQEWLFSIEEPEEFHHLVLDKCRNDPEAMAYFMKHVNGEFK